MNHPTHTTIEKAPGAINTEGLRTDSTNALNFATGTRQSKAIAAQIAQIGIAGLAAPQTLVLSTRGAA